MACCRQGSPLCCLRCRFLFDNTIVRDKSNLVAYRLASINSPSFERGSTALAGRKFTGKLNGLFALKALLALLGIRDSFALAVRQAITLPLFIEGVRRSREGVCNLFGLFALWCVIALPLVCKGEYGVAGRGIHVKNVFILFPFQFFSAVNVPATNTAWIHQLVSRHC